MGGYEKRRRNQPAWNIDLPELMEDPAFAPLPGGGLLLADPVYGLLEVTPDDNLKVLTDFPGLAEKPGKVFVDSDGSIFLAASDESEFAGIVWRLNRDDLSLDKFVDLRAKGTHAQDILHLASVPDGGLLLLERVPARESGFAYGARLRYVEPSDITDGERDALLRLNLSDEIKSLSNTAVNAARTLSTPTKEAGEPHLPLELTREIANLTMRDYAKLSWRAFVLRAMESSKPAAKKGKKPAAKKGKGKSSGKKGKGKGKSSLKKGKSAAKK